MPPINGLSLALDLVVALLNHAAQISQMVKAAQDAGRTSLTVDEWGTLIASDDSAEAKLAGLLAAAKEAKAT